MYHEIQQLHWFTLHNYTKYVVCDVSKCWVLIGIACAITAILAVAVIVCIVFTCVLAKGVRFMIQYFSASGIDRANGEHNMMMVHQNQRREAQNDGINITIAISLITDSFSMHVLLYLTM